MGIFLKKPDIVCNLFDLVNTHTPFDTPVDCIFLIERKIVSCMGAQKNDNFFEGTQRPVFKRNGWFGDNGNMTKISDNLCRKLLHWRYNICQSFINGASGHTVKLGRFGRLYKNSAAFFLYGAQAKGSVGTHTRKNNTDRVLLKIISQRSEKEINGQAQSSGFHHVK